MDRIEGTGTPQLTGNHQQDMGALQAFNKEMAKQSMEIAMEGRRAQRDAEYARAFGQK
jgi:hypothetical protein